MIKTIVTKILCALAAVWGCFTCVVFILFKIAKSEQKAQEKENEALKNNLEAVQAGEEAAREVRKENEELIEKAKSGNNLDAFNAVNELLSK